jgi:hypothetical protein
MSYHMGFFSPQLTQDNRPAKGISEIKMNENKRENTPDTEKQGIRRL